MNKKKNKKQKYSIILWLCLFLIIFAASIYTMVKLIQNRNSDTIVNTQNEPVVKIEETAQKTPTFEQTAKKVSALPEQIPILMYHHIRSYENSNDKIGENLSVSPESLADQLDYLKMLGYTPVNFYDLESGSIPEKPIILTFDDGYDNFFINAVPKLAERGMKAVVYVIANKTNKTGYMTEAQIKSSLDAGIEIGSHTLSHPDLTKLSTEKAIKEIEQSKSILEKITGNRVISFCYPAGKHNDETEKIVADSAYLFATTTRSGRASLLNNNNFSLERYRINKDTNIKNFIK